MLCRKPLVLHKNPDAYFKFSNDPKQWLKGIPVPCGQCLMCRINKRRQWTTRLLLEAMAHKDNSFWTLTYNDDNLPFAQESPSLVYRDIQLFLKRLRKSLHPFRFYCACEYGSKSFRPHYHLILFGVSHSDAEVVSRCWSSKTSNTISHCFLCYGKHSAEPIFEINSSLGNVYLGYDSSYTAMQYVAGYVTKKLSADRLSRRDPDYRTRYIDGRERERAIMSRNPGIGIPTLLEISKQLYQNARSTGSFPTYLEFEHKRLPFDRTLLAYLSVLFPEYFNPLDSAYRAKAEYDLLVSNPDLLSSASADMLDRLGKVGTFRFLSDDQKAKNIEAKLKIKGVFDREA